MISYRDTTTGRQPLEKENQLKRKRKRDILTCIWRNKKRRPRIKFHFGKQKQQFDSVSCGVFALLNAAELVLMNTDMLQRNTDLDKMECLKFLGKGRNENSWQGQTFPEVLEMRERLKFLYSYPLHLKVIEVLLADLQHYWALNLR